LKHFTVADFWKGYEILSKEVQVLADKSFDLLKKNPRHPSLQFKKIQNTDFWSARVGLYFRVLAFQKAEGFVWFWIGTHAQYNKLIGKK